MNIKTFLNDINIFNEDKNYLIILLLFSLLITIYMINFHQIRGAFNSDIYIYLMSALDYAGLNNYGLSEITWIANSPVICFLTSILFSLGFIDITSIFVVTGVFGILGIFGMYVFLKIRFSPLLSFLGSILYSSFSLTLYYFANGMLDTPAVALIIWTLIFTVAAVNKNYKYYVLVSLSFFLSFFTRYVTAYILALILLYILKNHDWVSLLKDLFFNFSQFKNRIVEFSKKEEFKWIGISILIGLVLFGGVFLIIYLYTSQLSYFSMATESLARYSDKTNPNYIVDKLFYLKNYLSLLFSDSISFNRLLENFNSPSYLSYVIVLILSIGFILKIINTIRNISFYKVHWKISDIKNTSILIQVIFIILLFSITIISFKFNYLISIFSFWLSLIILLRIADNFPINKDNFTLSVMCFCLFVFYFIIFSFIDLKCVRYILPTFPAFVYFFIYALDYILKFIYFGFDDEDALLNKLKDENIKENIVISNMNNFNIRNALCKVIPIILIILFVWTAFNFTDTVSIADEGLDIENVCDFLVSYDSDYQSKNIMSYIGRYYEWNLKKDIDLMDNEKIDSLNYTYIISYSKLNNENYHEIYRSGEIYLYALN